jgi:hypothetical protein
MRETIWFVERRDTLDEIVCAQDDRYGAGVAGGTGSSTSEKNKKECQGFSLFKHLISTLPNYCRSKKLN